MNSNPKSSVAISGATSFTGLWIAREFASKGWQVHAQCSQVLENYTGLRRLRAELLRDIVSVQWNRKVEDFPVWIREIKPKIWVHHHHFMRDFRSQTYDSAQAFEVCLKPLAAIIEALAESGCQGIIYSGSFFEPGEGGKDRTSPPTPYAESKKAVWEELRRLAGAKHIPVSKMVIPNPIGPFENEDRLIPQMIEKSKQGQSFCLGSPASVSDQLPVTHLARSYVRLAENLLQGKPQVLRSSGWVCTVEELVHAVNRELIVKRLGLSACPIETAGKLGVPTSFINSQDELEVIDWSGVWDHYAEWVQRYPISRF